MTSVFKVSNVDELQSALLSAQGGDTIELAGGEYGATALRSKSDFNLEFSEDVTIVSADPDDPAVFTGFTMVGAKNVVIDNVVFDYRQAEGDKAWEKPFGFYDVEGLTIRNSRVDGDLAQGVSAEEDGFGYGIGIIIRGSQDVVFEGNEISKFWKGIKVTESQDVVLRDNDVHSMRMDGINFAEVQGILIEGNHVHDFHRTTLHWDHADMIQSWTASTENPSTDIIIRGNTLDIGAGDETQSIFMGNTLVDRGEAGEEMYFRNVVIENNLIVNAHTHGIALGASVGVQISGNRVLHGGSDPSEGPVNAVDIPRISLSDLSSEVSVTGNVTAELRAEGEYRPDWTVTDNVIVQNEDVNSDNHYTSVFVGSSIDSHEFIPLEDGIANHLGLPVQNTLQVLFHSEIDAENTATRIFDASYSQLNTAALPEGAIYEWEFGDGTTARGVQVAHTFPDSGSYAVTLQVSVPGYALGHAAQEIHLQHPVLLDYTVDAGLVLSLPGATVPDAGAGGIVLGASQEPALTIDRAALSDIFVSENFSIELGVTLTENTTGTVFRLGRDINAWVTTDGDLRVSVATQGEQIFLMSQDLVFANGASHDLGLRLGEGVLELVVNGAVVDSSAMHGTLSNLGNHSFWLGTPWGTSAAGVVESLRITANEDRFSPATVQAPSPEFLQPEVQEEPSLLRSVDAFDPPADVFEFAEGSSWTSVVEFDASTGFTYRGHEALDIDYIASRTGLLLESEGISGSIDRSLVDTLASSDGLQLTFTLRSDADDSSGQLLNLAGSVSTFITEDGDLLVRAHTQEHGSQRFLTEGIDLSNGEARDVTITVTQERIQVSVDGVSAIDTALPSPIAAGNSAGLIFGNTWDQSNFTGVLESFEANIFDYDRSSATAQESESALEEKVFDCVYPESHFDF